MESASASFPCGDLLWEPTPEFASQTNLIRYLHWLEASRGQKFSNYQELWEWSTTDLAGFWNSIAEFFQVQFHRPPERVLSSLDMPGAHWFPGATLNYAEHALRQSGSSPAVLFVGEPGPGGQPQLVEISRTELRRQVTAIAAKLREFGVMPGDRVVAYMPNLSQTVVAFLAAASVGAIWSGCPSELSSQGVVERFRQIEPTVIFAVKSYRYGGKIHDRSAVLTEVVAELPTLRQVVLIADEAASLDLREDVALWYWNDLVDAPNPPELRFEPMPFEHPLWILYSSGTTGAPKAIVQGHGGILLEHLKVLSLHLDLHPGDRFFWYTTAGWMMWNLLISGLLLPEVAIVLYDGSPKYPNFSALWELADRLGVAYFGASAPYILACMKDGILPGKRFAFAKLRAIGSTGSPLPSEGFHWIYDEVKHDLLLGSISGGTDVCTAFVLCNPLLPVRTGELQCRGLGARIEAWDESGQPTLDQMGELVLPAPFPSMPLFLWNDPVRKISRRVVSR